MIKYIVWLLKKKAEQKYCEQVSKIEAQKERRKEKTTRRSSKATWMYVQKKKRNNNKSANLLLRIQINERKDDGMKNIQAKWAMEKLREKDEEREKKIK